MSVFTCIAADNVYYFYRLKTHVGKHPSENKSYVLDFVIDPRSCDKRITIFN